jgi:phosphotransferase system  glucose/maltose/N-acetylglucosamine-specific IIC component
VSSFVRTMIPLRWLAVGSNIGFVVYGLLHPSLMMVVLHLGLLPINLYRVKEMTRLTRRVIRATSKGDDSGVWLKPYMRKMQMKAGQVLFRKGDPADHLFLVVEGQVEFAEIGVTMAPGKVFGEIAFFSPEHRRTLTARCLDDCTLLAIDEATVKQLYYQNPDFGFLMISLVAGRLSADVKRLEKQVAELKAANTGAAAAP